MFWQALAIKAEKDLEARLAVSYWQAAVKAAKLLKPSKQGDATLLWLRRRLFLAATLAPPDTAAALQTRCEASEDSMRPPRRT